MVEPNDECIAGANVGARGAPQVDNDRVTKREPAQNPAETVEPFETNMPDRDHIGIWRTCEQCRRTSRTGRQQMLQSRQNLGPLRIARTDLVQRAFALDRSAS